MHKYIYINIYIYKKWTYIYIYYTYFYCSHGCFLCYSVLFLMITRFKLEVLHLFLLIIGNVCLSYGYLLVCFGICSNIVSVFV